MTKFDRQYNYYLQTYDIHEKIADLSYHMNEEGRVFQFHFRKNFRKVCCSRMSVINLLGFYLDVNENKSYKGAELFQTLDFLNFSGLSELSEIIIRNVQQTWDTRALIVLSLLFTYFLFKLTFLFHFRGQKKKLTARIAVLANYPAMATFNTDIQFLRDEKTKTRRVQVCAGANNFILWKTAEFPCKIR